MLQVTGTDVQRLSASSFFVIPIQEVANTQGILMFSKPDVMPSPTSQAELPTPVLPEHFLSYFISGPYLSPHEVGPWEVMWTMSPPPHPGRLTSKLAKILGPKL